MLKEPTFDKDGYPTDETLQIIKEWKDDYESLMQFVKKAWRYGHPYFTTLEDGVGYDFKKKEYQISTGGWSGNEDIIEALKNNTMFWVLCWEESRRGGHYRFRV